MPTTMPARRAAALFVAAACVKLLGCSSSQKGAAPAASASASAGPAASSAGALDPTDRDTSDEVRPNYPITHDPPDPLAEKLCEALYKVPNDRRAACCNGVRQPDFTHECARVLSYALKVKAVTVAEADVAACRAAVDKQHEGCDWVTPLPQGSPEACEDVVKGTLHEKAKCRSTLECSGALTCVGVGPTTLGTCEKPAKVGAFCGTGVDPLASLVGARGYEKAHPPCDGVCYRNRCVAPREVGAACKSAVECGPGRHCLDEKCSDKPLPAVGQPC
ncbi:MAG TPA: hypothetical protein VHB21_01655, partial [Minicystis sp.]|nr:hypothetical protein [Minicystis sp.]